MRLEAVKALVPKTRKSPKQAVARIEYFNQLCLTVVNSTVLVFPCSTKEYTHPVFLRMALALRFIFTKDDTFQTIEVLTYNVFAVDLVDRRPYLSATPPRVLPQVLLKTCWCITPM